MLLFAHAILFRINLTEDGKDSLLRISQGDMRKVLNILQACHAGFRTINSDAIYACTGAPNPSTIQSILKILMAEDFTNAYLGIKRAVLGTVRTA